MSGVRIRLNEAELLKVLPRHAVVALRQIIEVVGSGLVIGDISDVEALVLTTSRNDGQQANTAQELQRMGEQIGQIRRESLAFQQGVTRELECLQQAVRRNDQQQEIGRLREQINLIPKPNFSGIQAKLDELTTYVMGTR